MKKLMLCLVAMAALMILPLGVQAYTITDPAHDAIGVRTFEAYGIDVYNYYGPGGMTIDLFTNYPQSGLTVGSWVTTPADLFIRETFYGVQYDWAIPLVTHGLFDAGTMYAVGTYQVSDNLEPPGGGYTYNHNVPVLIATGGSNYGYSSFAGGTVTWNDITPPGSPDWQIRIGLPVYQDDPNGSFAFTWGTATCANDVISGSFPAPVPEPSTMVLLGGGLIGLGLVVHRRKKR